MRYQVFALFLASGWRPVSRVFERENDAQSWALDLSPLLAREIRRVE